MLLSAGSPPKYNGWGQSWGLGIQIRSSVCKSPVTWAIILPPRVCSDGELELGTRAEYEPRWSKMGEESLNHWTRFLTCPWLFTDALSHSTNDWGILVAVLWNNNSFRILSNQTFTFHCTQESSLFSTVPSPKSLSPGFSCPPVQKKATPTPPSGRPTFLFSPLTKWGSFWLLGKNVIDR